MRRSTSSSIRSSRRKFVWARSFLNAQGVSTVSPVKINLLSSFEADYGANLIGATVTRIRGVIATGNNISPAAQGQMTCAARISNDAEPVGAGTGGPYDQPHLDWMMWEPFVYSLLPTNPATGDSPGLVRVVDVKAQRKLEEINEELTMWLQANQTTFTVSWNLSIGLKLP